MSFFLSILLILAALYVAVNWSKSKSNSKSSTDKKNSGYSKWIGGGIGWAFGGPIGALLGFSFGKIFEDMNAGRFPKQSTRHGDFKISLLILSAAVMKADGSVKRSELDYVKGFFLQNFGKEASEEYILMLREILKQEINVREVSMQIGQFMEYASKLQLLHYLFNISRADGQLTPVELNLLVTIAGFMGIQPADFASIKAMFIKETDGAYKILEVTPEASNEEVKKAYKDMALKFHPDKVNHLGDEIRNAAEEKFKQVSEAYDQIKKVRGFK
ncbi:MAG: molecular chaperone DjlA [Bacteroidetes bacterium HGW-Bacteroidetes-1]|jgi:DnaJ like chaperone protein|nr:MAG: molecular chaperone DjlA [Bacteroidetes bacterium HGW-Bacteroidetes-1]